VVIEGEIEGPVMIRPTNINVDEGGNLAANQVWLVLTDGGKSISFAASAMLRCSVPVSELTENVLACGKLDRVKRLKELERENARLRKAVSDLTLEKVILKEAASGKW
jgi:hypothetical protein